MSLKQRGQEVTIRITVEGQPQLGSFIKIKDWTSTPRSDIVEEDYLGEDETDLDFQHHGYDFSFTVDQQDGKVHDYLQDIVEREKEHLRPAAVTFTVIHTYREPGERGRIEVFNPVFLRVNEMGFSGRKDNVAGSFEGKAKRRQLLTA